MYLAIVFFVFGHGMHSLNVAEWRALTAPITSPTPIQVVNVFGVAMWFEQCSCKAGGLLAR